MYMYTTPEAVTTRQNKKALAGTHTKTTFKTRPLGLTGGGAGILLV